MGYNRRRCREAILLLNFWHDSVLCHTRYLLVNKTCPLTDTEGCLQSLHDEEDITNSGWRIKQ